MAAKGRLRFWLVGVTAFVGLTGLCSSNLYSSESTPRLHQIVRHHSKRELVEVPQNATGGKRVVYTVFEELERVPNPFNDRDAQTDQPSAKCPIADPSMDPCRCRSVARGIVVECRDVEGRNQLTNALAGLQNYVISEAKLTGLNFPLGNEDLDRTKFVQLQFLRGKVQIQGAADTFSFARNADTKTALKAVLFVSCDIDLGETTLSRAPSVLTALEFFGARFSVDYREEWFAGLRVDQLRIHDSESIRAPAAPIALKLAGLKSYEHTKCDLKEISSEFLPLDKGSLTRLDFSMNSLESLPQDMFNGIPNLEEVLLGSNKFASLAENVFENVWAHMLKLDVKGNYYLKCESLEWLRDKPREERAKVKGTCIDDSGVEVDLQQLTEIF